MSSSAAWQLSFAISDEDTLPYLMESAAQCRIKATVRPEMSVLKSIIDMLMQAAEQVNASATELKKMLIGEEQ